MIKKLLLISHRGVNKRQVRICLPFFPQKNDKTTNREFLKCFDSIDGRFLLNWKQFSLRKDT